MTTKSCVGRKTFAMIRKENIRPGAILRMLSGHLGTPVNALANKRITKRQYLYREYLWESDIGCVETVTNLNGIVGPPVRRSHSPFEPVTPRRQLDLPFQAYP
jgi:hypothetical protein